MLYEISVIDKSKNFEKVYEGVISADSSYDAIDYVKNTSQLSESLNENHEIEASPVAIKSVTFNDASEYKENGQLFWKKYTRSTPISDEWICEYGTNKSSCCKQCGEYNHDTNNCSNEKHTATTDEIMQMMYEFGKNDKYSIDTEYCKCLEVQIIEGYPPTCFTIMERLNSKLDKKSLWFIYALDAYNYPMKTAKAVTLNFVYSDQMGDVYDYCKQIQEYLIEHDIRDLDYLLIFSEQNKEIAKFMKMYFETNYEFFNKRCRKIMISAYNKSHYHYSKECVDIISDIY